MAGPRKYNTRFRPAKNFEGRVYDVVSGVSVSAGKKRTTKDEVTLKEVGEFISDRVREIASEAPVKPRSSGGLRRARLVSSGQLVPRNNYDFRREAPRGERLEKPYLTSFTEPIVTMNGGRLEVRVLNLSPNASGIETGTGTEGSKFSPKKKDTLRLPISQQAYKRIANHPRDPRWISSRKDYRAAAQRQYRLVHRDESLDRKLPEQFFKNGNRRKRVAKFGQVEKNGTGSKTILRRIRNEAQLRAQGEINPNKRFQIRDQTSGYGKRFVEIQRRVGSGKQTQLKVGRTEEFPIKRRKWLVFNKSTKRAYLGTNEASRYDGYGIFFRAIDEAVRRFF